MSGLAQLLVRPTIRVRLTLLYGLSFLVAGAVLTTIMYLLVREQLRPGQAVSVLLPSEPLAGQPRPPEGLAPGPPPSAEVLGPVPTSPGGEVALADRVDQFVDQSLRALLWQSALVLLFAGALAVLLGWLLAGRALAPLQEVTRTARRVSERGLHERIGLSGPDDEVKQLADTFDAMLERLDRAFDAQRRFVGNASHELRTPLAINRTLLEVASAEPDASEDVRRLAAPLLATNARSERLIEGLLLLARSQQEVAERRPVDLAEVATTAADLTAGEAERRGIEVHRSLAPAPAGGEPVLLERLAVNLLQNAVRHNDEGGRVDVSTEQADDEVVLEVRNTGPVVPSYEVEGLFEPFRRGSSRLAGEGYGLGLSIVRAVATAHGGRVEARPGDRGGLVVRVALPARRPADGGGGATTDEPGTAGSSAPRDRRAPAARSGAALRGAAGGGTARS